MDKNGIVEVSAGPEKRCLFSGRPRPSDNLVEHLIQKKLGGRWCSREVTHGDFNNGFSVHDEAAIQSYQPILNTLGPLMSHVHRLGDMDVDIPGSRGRYVLKPGGVASPVGNHVLERGADGRPAVMIGDNEKALLKAASQISPSGGAPQISYASSTPSEEYHCSQPSLGFNIEFALLKSALSVFDHLLAKHPSHRFTRSDALRDTIGLVRDFLSSEPTLSARTIRRTLQGIHYDLLPEMTAARAFAKNEERAPEFEHLLVASGDPNTRRIYIVWTVLGFEPFCFCVSNTWDGGRFSYAAGCDPLIGGQCFGPTALEHPVLPRTISGDGSVFLARADKNTLRQHIDTITERRHRAHRRATLFAEKMSPEVRDNIGHAGALAVTTHGRPMPVSGVLADRLRRLYAPEHHSRIEGLFAERLSEISEPVRSEAFLQGLPGADDSHISWDMWIAFYRSCVDILNEQMGPPGHQWTRGFSLET